MRFKHKTFLLVLPVLLVTALFFSSCTEDDPNPVDSGDDPRGTLVESLDISMLPSQATGYYGSTDTLNFVVTARDRNQSPVADVSINFPTPPQMGTIELVSGSRTDANGQLQAMYILTFLEDGSESIVAEVGAQRDTHQMTVDAQDVQVVATATPQQSVVIAGDPAQSQIRVTVQNNLGVAVSGVPIGLQILSGAGQATLGEPVFNQGSTSYNSTLSADEVQDVVEVQVRAYIDVAGGIGPAPQSVEPGKKEQLPVITPEKPERVITGIGKETGGAKKSDEMRVWEARETDNTSKGGSYNIAEVVSADTITVRWTTWGSQVSNIFLDINPDELAVEPNMNGTATLTAVAADENYNGIPGLQLYLRMRNTENPDAIGTISIPDTTDANGRTTATISTNGEYGTWTIEARTTPTQEDPWTTQINVYPGSQVVNAYLAVQPNEIYTEPGTSATANVTLVARDANNNGVSNYQMFLKLLDQNDNEVGTITAPDSTDSTGRDNARIYTDGAYGDWTVELRAYQGQEPPLATADLSVIEGSSIKNINLSIEDDFVRAEPNANKEVNFTATAQDDQNNGLENRTIFYRLVRADGGVGPVGTITANDTTDSAGVSRGVINTEGNYGVWRVESRAYPSQDPPMATRTLEVVEGSDVQDIAITVSPDQLTPLPETADTAMVYLVAKDENGAGVQDAELSLSVRNIIPGGEVGSVAQPDSTGPSGTVTAELTTNGQYGTWIVEARPYATSNLVFTDTVRVLEGTAQYIEVVPDTNKISVRGTNGIEQTTLRATVYDENDVPIQDGTWVYFVARQYPYEPTNQYHLSLGDDEAAGPPNPTEQYPYNVSPFDSATVNNGTATVTLSSGGQKGLVWIEVYTLGDDNDHNNPDVSTMFSGVQVVAGPPAAIEVGYSPVGYDATPLWNIEASARVTDSRGNDVINGYQVFFSVAPDYATVWDYGFTGNTAPHSTNVTPGVAYTSVSYHSEFTNYVVTLTAWVLDADGNEISDDLEVTLPIQTPSGVLTVQPANWDFRFNTDPAVFQLRLDVFDGHDYPIDYQLVSYSPDKGNIYKGNDPNNQVPGPFAYTYTRDWPQGSPNDIDPHGVAIRYLHVSEDEAFPDPAVLETQIQIAAAIIGVPESTVEPQTVFLIHVPSIIEGGNDGNSPAGALNE